MPFNWGKFLMHGPLIRYLIPIFQRPVASPPLLTTEKRDLNRFVMRLHILKGVVLFNMRRVVNDFLPNSKKLIALIKEEYHLE